MIYHRDRKKRIEKPRRFSRSLSRTPSPPPFRGRNTAMDAQEALARRFVYFLLMCFSFFQLEVDTQLCGQSEWFQSISEMIKSSYAIVPAL